MKNMTKFYIFIIFLFTLMFFSCSNNQRDSILSVFKEWEQREIKFPSNSVFTKLACDTVKMDIQSEFKILTYIDSVGCTSCKLQMPLWKEFIFETDSNPNNNVVFVFYICPKDKKGFEYILKRDRFDYPVCIDELDSLNILNQFSSDSRFHTFLLDKNNKVLAIGNPMHNPKIKELYLKIISGKDSFGKLPLTTISFLKNKIDLGIFSWLEKMETEIVISNTGKVPLVLNDVNTFCGCMTVEYDKKPVRPGRSTSLKIFYKAERPERFDKTLSIYCNAENAPFQLHVSGNAK